MVVAYGMVWHTKNGQNYGQISVSQMHTHAYRVIIFYSYPIRIKNVFFKRFLYFLISKNKIFIVL